MRKQINRFPTLSLSSASMHTPGIHAFLGERVFAGAPCILKVAVLLGPELVIKSL